MGKIHLSLRLTLAAGVLGVVASAQAGGISDPGLLISASNATGSGSYPVFLSNGTFSTTYTLNDTWEWTAPVGGYDIFDADFNLISHIDNMHCKMIAEPSIVVDFSVNGGAVATHFTISSGLLSFAAFNGQARASASVTITDNDSDGAFLLGGHAGAKAFRTNYNGAIPGGTVFANLISTPLIAAVDDSNGANQDSPAFGYTPIGVVGDMQAQWDFDLSANDSASGESFYEIVPVPSPAGTALLGAAGLFSFARRRRA